MPAMMLSNSRSVRPCPAVSAVANQRLVVATPNTHIVPVSKQTKDVRNKLFKECLGGGIIYLEAGEPVLRNGSDVFHAFRADSNFLYTTGVNQPGFSCLLDVDDGTPRGPMHAIGGKWMNGMKHARLAGTFTLLAPRQPPEAAYWIGGLPLLEDLAEEFGADK